MALISGNKVKEYRWTYGMNREDLIAKAGLTLDTGKMIKLEEADQKAPLEETDLSKLLAFSKWPIEFFQGSLDKIESDMVDYFRQVDSGEEKRKQGLSEKEINSLIRPAKLKPSTMRTHSFDHLYWMFKNCYLLENDNRFNISPIETHEYAMALLAAQFYDFVRDTPQGAFRYLTDYHLLIRRKSFRLRKAPGDYKLGERLGMARKHLRLSFSELSSNLGISPEFLVDIERNPEGRVPREMRRKIGKFVKDTSFTLSNNYYFKLYCFQRETYENFLKKDKPNFQAKELLPEYDHVSKRSRDMVCKIHLTIEKYFL